MVIVTVEFEVVPDDAPAFVAAMRRQAEVCRAIEPGCLRFDVAVDPDRADRVFLCELFADEAAVKHHNDTPHLRTFRPTVAPMIVSRRLQSWSLVAST